MFEKLEAVKFALKLWLSPEESILQMTIISPTL